jgi:hypothetical protein
MQYCLSVVGGDWHDDAAWGRKKSRGVTMQMERVRVAVNAGDNVVKFLKLVHVFTSAPRRKHIVGEVVPHPIARIDHD